MGATIPPSRRSARDANDAPKCGAKKKIGPLRRRFALAIRGSKKHDKRDALLLQLLVEKRFPRIWTLSREQRDLRQLLIHRHKLVRMRVQVHNGLQHLAMSQGVLKKHKLWSKAGQQALRELPLGHPAVLSDQFSERANYL